VTIGVVGKYVGLQDAYKSLNEALAHGGMANRVKVNVRWIDAEVFEKEDDEIAAQLEPMHGILVPGGFGERGSEGKIAAVRFARERNVPFFGICLGMQMACIEGARNTADRRGFVDRIRPDQGAGGRHHHRMDDRRRPRREAGGDLGGTMRLGAYEAQLAGNSHVAAIYDATTISERHRHRYEVNVAYREALEQGGLRFWACRPMACCPKSSSARTIRSSSACSSTPNQEPSVRSASAVQGLHRRGGQAGPSGLIEPGLIAGYGHEKKGRDRKAPPFCLP
jgi:CTP synthase